MFGVTALHQEHFPRKGLLFLSRSCFPSGEGFPHCSHPGFAELLGTQGKMLVQEESTLAALRLWHSSAWGQCWIQSQLQTIIYFVYFYFMQREKKGSRQKGCNSRFIPLSVQLDMYEVASTHPAAHHLQRGAWLAPR